MKGVAALTTLLHRCWPRSAGGRPYWASKTENGPDPAALGRTRDLLARCGLERGGRVLDIGAGTGRWLPLLAEDFDEVHAVEPDDDRRATLRAAVDRLGAAGKKIRVAAWRAERLEYPAAFLDAVFCHHVFPYLDQPRALAEMFRTLRPGGWVFVTSNGAGYFLLQVALGIRFNVPSRVGYGLRCLVGTLAGDLLGRPLVGQRFSSISRVRHMMEAQGFAVVRAEPWLSHDLFPLVFMSLPTNFAVLGRKPPDRGADAGASGMPWPAP